jgi:VWFA-related protein
MTRFPACVPLLTVSLCLAQLCAAQTPAVPTLKAKAQIVVVDVVVTDKQGKPVKDLQVSDFALAENGAPQTINHFEAHTSLSAEDVAKLAAMPKLEPNIFTNYSPVPANGALNVLVFDALNSKMTDQAVVLQQMQKYLAIPHPGVRMELFQFNSELRLLQGFTFDQDLLLAALRKPKSAPQASMLTTTPMSDDPGIENMKMYYGRGATNGDPGKQMDSSDALTRRGEGGGLPAFQLRDRQLSTLDAMNALARYMGGLPGRKNLLWFSAVFPISVVKTEIDEKLHETMALFARNQVAVYPIDARGERVNYDRLGPSRTPYTTETMDEMAEDTGGKVFKDTNDIAAAVDEAVEDGSNYYTLTYTPTNHDWKGEFRKVEVKLAQKGYSLAYRPGYYADDVDKPDRKEATGAPATATTPDPARVALNSAMEYGSPQPSGIVLKVAVNPATGQPENVVAKANYMSPKVTGPFERYVVSVAALPTAFTFTRDVPGKIHMSARLVTRVYSADGALINTTTLNEIGDIDDARYQSIMADGMQFRQEISVPVKGESFLRIGVEDLATNRVGVVEIPVAMVAKLKPLAGEKVSQK